MRAAEPSGPLKDDELTDLFAPLEGAGTVALAVSGGADSLALLHVFSRWRRSHHGVSGVVLTVDHRLRAGSRKEAASVAATARKYGFEARVLSSRSKLPSGNLEAAARETRYRLLLSAARTAGARHLLLAHHRDDQAETLLLRIARGSGVFGLSAMRRVVEAGTGGDAVSVFRPLLGLSRARLAATCAEAGLEPVADPMNSDPRFARARLRRIMPLLEADGIGAERLAATAARLAAAADALDEAASHFLAARVACDALGIARFDRAVLSELPREVGLRAVARIVLAIGGEAYVPRFEKLTDLYDSLIRFNERQRLKRTLGGAVVEDRAGRVIAYREAGREGLPSMRPVPGEAIVWDGRFRIVASQGAGKGLTVGPLGEEGRRRVGAGGDRAPLGALAALPALWRRKSLISVPLLGFEPEAGAGVEMRSILGERLPDPPRFPEFSR